MSQQGIVDRDRKTGATTERTPKTETPLEAGRPTEETAEGQFESAFTLREHLQQLAGDLLLVRPGGRERFTGPGRYRLTVRVEKLNDDEGKRRR